MNFVEVDTVSLLHKCRYEFDIGVGKDPSATTLVSMGIICCAISMEILESLVDGGLPNTKDGTDLIHTETLLKEKGWDPCLQIMRKRVWRHDDKIINPYIYYLTARIEPEESHALVRKKVVFPHTYERCCKSNKIAVNMKIFEDIDIIKLQGVFCQL